MQDNPKTSLRRLLLERRDGTSADLLNIAARRIGARLDKVDAYRNAVSVGMYHSIGSEIPTRGMIQTLLYAGRKVCLPRVTGNELEFREITDSSSLEAGSFGIMEPKVRCPVMDSLDVVLVPSVGISLHGDRLGYGRGFYDRYLEMNDIITISPVLEKQIVRQIPRTRTDHTIDWIVTEDRIHDTSIP